MGYPIIDIHTDVILAYQRLGKQFGSATNNTQISLPLLKKAGIKIIFGGFSYDDLLGNSWMQLSDHQRLVENFSNDLKIIEDLAEIGQLINSQQIGIIIHLEGGKILDNSISNLEILYEKGVRSLGLTHNTQNGLGTGATINDASGLTSFGKRVIKKCDELNIIIDVAHLNEKGFYEVFKLSKKPVIVSHANCFAITPNPRNLKDNQLREIKKANSLVGVFFSGKFLNSSGGALEATIDDAVLHIKHMTEVMGINHIAIGSDFGGITAGLPKGLENSSKIRQVFEKLHQQGYKEKELEKIAYQNAQRVLSEYT